MGHWNVNIIGGAYECQHVRWSIWVSTLAMRHLCFNYRWDHVSNCRSLAMFKSVLFTLGGPSRFCSLVRINAWQQDTSVYNEQLGAYHESGALSVCVKWMESDKCLAEVRRGPALNAKRLGASCWKTMEIRKAVARHGPCPFDVPRICKPICQINHDHWGHSEVLSLGWSFRRHTATVSKAFKASLSLHIEAVQTLDASSCG